MATNAENMDTGLSGITAKIASDMPQIAPDYSVDGLSTQRIAYMKALAELQKQMQEQTAKAAGPFEVYG